MNREEDMIRRACEEIAREETDAFEKSLTRGDIRQAEDAYRRHRKKALALISSRLGKRGGRFVRYLSAAAAVLLLLGGVYLSLRQNTPDPVPLSAVPTASVGPYWIKEPDDTPAPTPPITPAPTMNLNYIPTEKPIITEISDLSPTNTPIPTAIPTLIPTKSPLPTQTPFAETVNLQEDLSPVPPTWQGSYFPFDLPKDAVLLSCENGEKLYTAVYQTADGIVTFTEYQDSHMADIPEGAKISYVQWEETVALRLEDAHGVTLSWTMDGKSFSLFGPKDSAEAWAKGVRKIPEK